MCIETNADEGLFNTHSYHCTSRQMPMKTVSLFHTQSYHCAVSPGQVDDFRPAENDIAKEEDDDSSPPAIGTMVQNHSQTGYRISHYCHPLLALGFGMVKNEI